MMKDIELYRFGPLELVTPYILCAGEVVLLSDLGYRVV